MRRAPDPAVEAWAAGATRIFLSVVTVEEIFFGLGWKPNPRVLARFEKILEDHCDILPVTDVVARKSGALRGQLRSLGKTRSQANMLLAATASVHGLTLVTRDARDFEGCGIAVLNPFAS